MAAPRPVVVEFFHVTKYGTKVYLNRYPDKVWYFVPGAKFTPSRRRCFRWIMFPGQFDVRQIMKAITSAPFIVPRTKLSWEEAPIYHTFKNSESVLPTRLRRETTRPPMYNIRGLSEKYSLDYEKRRKGIYPFTPVE